MKPDDWRTLTENGITLLRQGKPQKALIELQLAERKAPNVREVRYWLANACRMVGNGDRAHSIFRKLLAENPGDFETSFALAFLLRDAGVPGDAADVLLKACEQPDVTITQLLQVSGFLRDSNQFSAAIQVCEKAVKLKPKQADLHFKLARLYQASGAFDLSKAAALKSIDLDPACGPAWTLLAQQKRFGDINDAEFLRIKTAAGVSHGHEADMCIAFAYGKALDDLGEWPEAWGQYQKGNQLSSSTRKWNRSGWEQFVERMIAKPVSTKPVTPGADRNAVFIVGMLRSGTTLLEQMLDRHPRISGKGETNFLAHFAQQLSVMGSATPERRSELADAFWTQLRLEGPEDDIYIDKNPLNFRYLDELFELLPNAKILHVCRDGRDSCLSCFFQLFAHEDTAFSNDLENLVDFYSGYRRLMAHWEKVYTEQIYRVNYEELVESRSEVLSGVLDFLGTSWNDAVSQTANQDGIVRTASVWQARQPLHTRSLARWRHYYDQAPAFFDSLSAIDSDY